MRGSAVDFAIRFRASGADAAARAFAAYERSAERSARTTIAAARASSSLAGSVASLLFRMRAAGQATSNWSRALLTNKAAVREVDNAYRQARQGANAFGRSLDYTGKSLVYFSNAGIAVIEVTTRQTTAARGMERAFNQAGRGLEASRKAQANYIRGVRSMLGAQGSLIKAWAIAGVEAGRQGARYAQLQARQARLRVSSLVLRRAVDDERSSVRLASRAMDEWGMAADRGSDKTGRLSRAFQGLASASRSVTSAVGAARSGIGALQKIQSAAQKGADFVLDPLAKVKEKANPLEIFKKRSITPTNIGALTGLGTLATFKGAYDEERAVQGALKAQFSNDADAKAFRSGVTAITGPTALETSDTVRQLLQLKEAGFSEKGQGANNVFDLTQALLQQTASSGGVISPENFREIFGAFRKMKVSGRFNAEEAEILETRGINASSILKQEMFGGSDSAYRSAREKGIDADKAIAAIYAGMARDPDGRKAQALKTQNEDVSGAAGGLADTLKSLKATLFSVISQDAIAGLRWLTQWATRITTMFQESPLARQMFRMFVFGAAALVAFNMALMPLLGLFISLAATLAGMVITGSILSSGLGRLALATMQAVVAQSLSAKTLGGFANWIKSGAPMQRVPSLGVSWLGDVAGDFRDRVSNPGNRAPGARPSFWGSLKGGFMQGPMGTVVKQIMGPLGRIGPMIAGALGTSGPVGWAIAGVAALLGGLVLSNKEVWAPIQEGLAQLKTNLEPFMAFWGELFKLIWNGLNFIFLGLAVLLSRIVRAMQLIPGLEMLMPLNQLNAVLGSFGGLASGAASTLADLNKDITVVNDELRKELGDKDYWKKQNNPEIPAGEMADQAAKKAEVADQKAKDVENTAAEATAQSVEPSTNGGMDGYDKPAGQTEGAVVERQEAKVDAVTGQRKGNKLEVLLSGKLDIDLGPFLRHAGQAT